MSDSAMAKEISDVVAHVSDIVCGAADDSGSLSVPATTPATLTTKQSDDGDVTKKRADRIEAKHEVLDVYDFVVSDEEFGEDEYEDDVRETKEEEERRLAGVMQFLDGFPDDAELSGASDGEWTPSSINAVSTPDGSSVFAAVDDDGGVSDEMGVQGGAEQSRALLPALNRQLGIMRVKRTQNAQSSLVVKKRRLGKIVPGKTVRGPKIAHVVFGAAGQCEVGEAPVPARGEATGQSSGAEESDADATTATDTTTKRPRRRLMPQLMKLTSRPLPSPSEASLSPVPVRADSVAKSSDVEYVTEALPEEDMRCLAEYGEEVPAIAAAAASLAEMRLAVAYFKGKIEDFKYDVEVLEFKMKKYSEVISRASGEPAMK